MRNQRGGRRAVPLLPRPVLHEMARGEGRRLDHSTGCTLIGRVPAHDGTGRDCTKVLAETARWGHFPPPPPRCGRATVKMRRREDTGGEFSASLMITTSFFAAIPSIFACFSCLAVATTDARWRSCFSAVLRFARSWQTVQAEVVGKPSEIVVQLKKIKADSRMLSDRKISADEAEKPLPWCINLVRDSGFH